jgi:hypothetical protein
MPPIRGFVTTGKETRRLKAALPRGRYCGLSRNQRGKITVGDTGLEPVTSSVSCAEVPLCRYAKTPGFRGFTNQSLLSAFAFVGIVLFSFLYHQRGFLSQSFSVQNSGWQYHHPHRHQPRMNMQPGALERVDRRSPAERGSAESESHLPPLYTKPTTTTVGLWVASRDASRLLLRRVRYPSAPVAQPLNQYDQRLAARKAPL